MLTAAAELIWGLQHHKAWPVTAVVSLIEVSEKTILRRSINSLVGTLVFKGPSIIEHEY